MGELELVDVRGARGHCDLDPAHADGAALLKAHDIQASMSRVGNPYDNAKAESFMKTLKHEEVDASAYKDAADARARIGAFIDDVYNRQRLHSALDYKPPVEYEATLPRLKPAISPASIAINQNCP